MGTFGAMYLQSVRLCCKLVFNLFRMLTNETIGNQIILIAKSYSLIVVFVFSFHPH